MAISIVKPSIGGDVGVWGTELNAALDALVAGINSALNTLASVPGTYATQQALTIAINGLSAQLSAKADSASLGTAATHPATDFAAASDGVPAGGSPTTYLRGDRTWGTPAGGASNKTVVGPVTS